MKIGIKISATFALIIIIVSAGLLVSLYQTREAMIDETSANAITFARGILDRLDQRVHTSMTELRIIALVPAVRDLVIQSNREFDKIDDVDSYIAEKDIEWRSYAGKENPIFNEMVKNPLSQKLEEFRQAFYKSDGIDIFPEIFVTNKYGATIAENNRLTDWNQSDELQFQNTRDYGWHVSDLEFDKSAGVWSLEVAVAVEDGDEFAGMLKTVFAIEEIKEILLESKKESQYNDFRVFLFTGDDRYIYSDNPTVGELGDDATATFIGYERHTTEEGHYIVDVFGIDRLTVWSTSDGYRDFPGLGWMLALSIPEQEFLGPVDEIQNILIGIMIISIAAVIVISALLVKGLQEIDRVKTEFINMISHEFKNPLIPIIGFSQALQKPKLLGEVNSKQLESLKKISRNAKSLESMMNNLLDVQNLESDRMVFDYGKFKVDELMRQVCKKFESKIIEKKIQLVNTTQDSIVIKSDEARVKQVLEHLIDNAIAFVPKENGKIEIDAQEADDSVSFFVKDNGVGISKEKQENLFKKFYQVSSGHTRGHGGVGLGISICKGIITKLGGKIWLESDVGKGTTFFFTIPKAD